jgi:hypothetical protein
LRCKANVRIHDTCRPIDYCPTKQTALATKLTILGVTQDRQASVLQGVPAPYSSPGNLSRSSRRAAARCFAASFSSCTLLSSASRRCAICASSDNKSRSFIECVIESNEFAARTWLHKWSMLSLEVIMRARLTIDSARD